MARCARSARRSTASRAASSSSSAPRFSRLGEQLGAATFAPDGPLSVSLEAQDREELAAIRQDIRELTRQIDGSHRDEFALLRDELRVIGERLETVPPERLEDLDRQLAGLIDRLDADGRGSLHEVNREISRLAEAVDLSSERISSMAGLHATISELFRRMEEERAPAEVVAALKDDVASLSTNVDAADQRNQETLTALNETLHKIVDRLADLEDEVDEVADHARSRHEEPPAGMVVERDIDFAPDALEPEIEPDADEEIVQRALADETEDDAGPAEDRPAGDLDADDLVQRIEAVARSFEDEAEKQEEDTTPLAPGSGRPQAAMASDRVEPRIAGHDQQSFIAAARRAAQAAAAEQVTGRKSVASAASRSGIGAFLAKYGRTVALAFAILLIVAGGIRVATIMLAPSAPAPATEAPGPQSSLEAEDEAIVDDPVVTGSIEGPRQVAMARPVTIEPPTGSIAAPVAATPEASTSSGVTPAVPSRTLPDAIGSEALREAALAGDPGAQFEIASRYTDGRGIAQDYAKAAQWYRLAAAQGLAPAQYRLGSLYEKGHGVTRDLSLARTWYQRAAEQGNRTAMHNLAVLHAEGVDGKPDYGQAALWFRQAAEYGLRDSQYNLAILHARGLGTEQNYSESYRWFSIAADQGDGEALAKRDELAARLDEQSIAAARLAIQSWQPKEPVTDANTVAEPQGGWDDQGPVAQAQPQSQPLFEGTEMIREVQSILTRLGFAPGPVDGQIGSRTRDAVTAFQRELGIPETGEITPDLMEELSRFSG